MQLSIQTRLFLGFTLLSSILVSSGSFLYYSQSSKDLLNRVEETNMQQLYRYRDALDHAVEDMDRISAQVVYSSDIKNYLYEQSEVDPSSYLSFSMRKKYEDMLASFNGPWFIASQINLISGSGFFLTYGQNMNTVADIPARISGTAWLNEALQLDGEKLLVPPHYSEWQENHPLTFSLVRSFHFPATQVPAVVEVQQTYDLLARTMETDSNESAQSEVYIIDDNGRRFYPFPAEGANDTQIPRWTGNATEVSHGNSGETDIWSQTRSDYSGLTILIRQPKSKVMQPIDRLRRITWFLAFMGECISLVIAYVLSAGIASPIRYLQTRFEKLSLDNMNVTTAKKLRNTKEIAQLYTTYEEMRARLNQSLTEVLQSQKRENLAHLQAMYAQMNPHFLFNTLTAMASYAEEAGFPELARFSQKLSGMLRYSGSGLSLAHPVTMGQELQYTTDYMELMQFRYEGRFLYAVKADPGLETEQVPKFLLQPLVENSFAHGFQQVRPPWIIEVTVAAADGNGAWEIRINDNGAGFSEEAYLRIQQLIHELNEGQIRQLDGLSSHGFGHMGIINTLTRCRLFWNDRVQFVLHRLPRGAEYVITIRRDS